MTRLEDIYVTAIDVVDEHFQNDIDKLIESESNVDFHNLGNAVVRRMIHDKQITQDDVLTYFMEINLMVTKACKDVIYMKKNLVGLNNEHLCECSHS